MYERRYEGIIVASIATQVVGEDRRPAMKDRGNIPYTEAAILEIQRLGSIGEYWNWLGFRKRRVLLDQIGNEREVNNLSGNSICFGERREDI